MPTLNKDVSEFDKFKCKLLDEKLSLNSNISSNNITRDEVLTNDVEEKKEFKVVSGSNGSNNKS